MKHITKIHGREILDSRGNPTVEVEVYLSNVKDGQKFIWQTVPLAGPRFPPVPPPVFTKPASSGTGILSGISARVSATPYTT